MLGKHNEEIGNF